MFSSVKEKIRSLLGEKPNNHVGLSRKRPREDVELDSLQTPLKRKREEISTGGTFLKTLSSPFNKLAELFVRGKLSFCDSYYFRMLKESVSPGQPSAETGAASQSARPAFDTLTELQQQSAPVSARLFTDPTDWLNFSMDKRETPKNFQSSLPKPTTKMDSHVPSSAFDKRKFEMRPPDPVNRNTTVQGGMYKSVYEKTFNRPMLSHRTMAAKEAIRLDERERYAQLLQQFTSVPLGGCVYKSSSMPRNKPVTELSYMREHTLLGMPLQEVKGSSLSGPRYTSTAIKPRSHISHIPKVTVNGDSRRTLKIRSRQDSNSSMTPIVRSAPRFDEPVDRLEQLSPVECVKPSPYHSKLPEPQSTIESQKPAGDDGLEIVEVTPGRATSPKSPSLSRFKESLDTSQCWTDEWFEKIKSRIDDKSKRRQHEITVEETKVQVFKEKRLQYEDDLARRIRERIRLSEREPAVLEETYEEEEEDKEDEFPELTEEMEDVIESALVSYPHSQVLVDEFRLQLTRQDIHTLAGLNWLNDEVINFYMNLLMERGKQEDFPSVHAFNTFFYPKLMSGGHAALRRWTRKIDIFAKDFILIPVHLGMHWCLAAVDFRNKCVRYYDSMGSSNPNCLRAILDYLKAESLDKKGKPFDTADWTTECVKGIPQQMNGSDCGMFACKFAEYITRNAEFTFTQEHMPYFRRRMVYEIMTKQLL